MLFEENDNPSPLAVSAYRDGLLEIGGKSYGCPVSLTDCLTRLPPQLRPEDLCVADLLGAAEGARPELVLVGTGEKQQFLHPRIAAELAAEGVGLACMNTAAACRTLLLLQSEQRRVWAWLWP